MKLLKYLCITLMIVSFVSTKLYAYNAESKPPQNLGAYPSSAYGERLMPGTSNTFTWSVGDTPLTGTGTTGYMGTDTVGGDAYAGFRWNGVLGLWQLKGPATAVWDAIATGTASVVKEWVVGGTTGTGTMNLAAGSGISLVPTYDGSGRGTVTVNAVGSSSAGGWLDTGSQTVANTGYLVRLQGQLILHPDGISGLVDSMIPNTITLDNITQITNRSLANMQGTVNNGQVDDDITLTNITQITNRSLANMQGDIELGTQTTGDYLTNWNCDGQVGTQAVNFETTDFDIVTVGGTKTVNLSAIAKGTTSPTAAYLVKLDGTGKVSTAQLPVLGDYTSKSVDTSYQAATDGFVIATINADDGGDRGYITAYCDGSNPPTTAIANSAANYATSVGNETWVQFNTITLPVKKNNYYKIALSNSNGTCVTTIYFIPLQ